VQPQLLLLGASDAAAAKKPVAGDGHNLLVRFGKQTQTHN
jgi:hypothetical protein